MSEDLKAKAREIMEDLPRAVEKGLIHPDYRHQDPVLPESMIDAMVGAKAYAQGAITFRESFPDLRTEAVWVLQDDDMTASRWRLHGTFTGKDFFGHPANGRAIRVEGMTMYRWRNGQVIEGMSLFDNTGLQRQVEAPPEQGEGR